MLEIKRHIVKICNYIGKIDRFELKCNQRYRIHIMYGTWFYRCPIIWEAWYISAPFVYKYTTTPKKESIKTQLCALHLDLMLGICY